MRIGISQFLARATIAASWTLLATCATLAADNQAAAYIQEDDRYIYAGNNTVELTFRKTDGRLYSLVDKSSQLDFLARKEAYWGPFNFQMNVTGEDEYINGGQASRFTYAAATDNDGPVLSLTWEQFRASRATPLDISVRITIRIPSGDGLTYWNISITNNESLIVRQVAFPDLEGIPQLSRDGVNDELTHPGLTGMLFQDPINNFRLSAGIGWEMMYPSTFAPMQLMTYSSRERRSGLYLATRDVDGHTKFFNMGKPAQDWMNIQVMHRPPLTPKTSFTPAFDVVVGVFSGDWYDAAQIYRTWALQQPWARTAAIPDSSQPTGWLPQLPLHQWLPTYPDCLDLYHFSLVPTVSQDTAQFMGQPVAIDWIGWEREAWYIGYPDVFPPKEGWLSFEDTLRKTRVAGNRIWAVPNTGSYSDMLPGWAADKTGAAVGDGGQYLGAFSYSECGKSTTFRTMCPASALWREKLRSLVLPLASRQVDMIQLDGFPMAPLPCTNPAHNHPPGGGNWWYLGYRDIFEGIKREARQLNPGIVFSAEGFAETYLSFLDSVWDPFTTGYSPASLSGALIDIGKFRLIPLWHTVYKEKAAIQSGVAFLNHSDYLSEMDFNVYGFAKALVWGEVPTTWYNYISLTNLTEPGTTEVAAYLKRIVGVRSNKGRDFLVNGRMLRTPEINVPLFRNPGMKGIPYTLADYPPFDLPSVLGSLWQAPNGDAGYVFTNISRDPVQFDLAIDAASALLPAQGRYDVSLVRNGAYSLVRTAAPLPATIPVSADSRDIILIRVSPSGSGSTLLPAISEGVWSRR